MAVRAWDQTSYAASGTGRVRVNDDRLRVLLVSPHPDDEIVGAPGTAVGLARAGHEVTNLALSIGRTGQQERRARELALCLERAGFKHDVAAPPIAMYVQDGDDLHLAKHRVTEEILARPGYDLIISPGPMDGHQAHQITALGIGEAVRQMDNPPRWWSWASSPRNWQSEIGSYCFRPTIYVPYGEHTMRLARWALSAHEGEVSRRDFSQLIVDRAKRSASWLGVSGYVDLFCEWPPISADQRDLVRAGTFSRRGLLVELASS